MLLHADHGYWVPTLDIQGTSRYFFQSIFIVLQVVFFRGAEGAENEFLTYSEDWPIAILLDHMNWLNS